MNIDKLRDAWQSDNPNVFRFKNIYGFIQFCWENKFTPDNTVTAYDEKEDRMYLVRKEHENEFN